MCRMSERNEGGVMADVESSSPHGRKPVLFYCVGCGVDPHTTKAWFCRFSFSRKSLHDVFLFLDVSFSCERGDSRPFSLFLSPRFWAEFFGPLVIMFCECVVVYTPCAVSPPA